MPYRQGHDVAVGRTVNSDGCGVLGTYLGQDGFWLRRPDTYRIYNFSPFLFGANCSLRRVSLVFLLNR